MEVRGIDARARTDRRRYHRRRSTVNANPMHAVQVCAAFGAAGGATLPKKSHTATALSVGTTGLRIIVEYNAAVPTAAPGQRIESHPPAGAGSSAERGERDEGPE